MAQWEGDVTPIRTEGKISHLKWRNPEPYKSVLGIGIPLHKPYPYSLYSTLFCLPYDIWGSDLEPGMMFLLNEERFRTPESSKSQGSCLQMENLTYQIYGCFQK